MVGIGIGWFFKSASGDGRTASAGDPSRSETAAPPAASAGIAPGLSAGRSGESPAGKSHARPPKEDKQDIAKLALDATTKHLMDTMQEQQTKRREERIAKLVEKLGLDASQEAKLRDYFKKQADPTVAYDGKSVQMTQRNDGPSLDDFLKDLLSDSQEQDYEKMKQAENEQRIEARTLRDMASLTQSVELRPEQRDAVYAALQEQTRNEESSPGPKMFGAGMITPPMELGGAGSSVDTVMSLRFAGPEGSEPDQSAIEQAQQQRQAQIDEKVNRMSGVLDEKQLDQYRASLGKGMVILPR